MDIDDNTKKLLATRPVQEYTQMMVENLIATYPLLQPGELKDAVTWAIINQHRIPKLKFDNNYTKQCIEGTTIDILNYIEKLHPIIGASGVLFMKHKEKDNPLSKMIQGFLKQRKVFKKEMFKYPRGSYEFEKYNLLQLLEKINANGSYGAMGAPSCLFYNIYVSSAVTTQGRSYLSTSLMFFESFLANNVKFNSLNEIIVYITNVVREAPHHNYDDKYVLDRDITRAECFFKLLNTSDPMVWIPTEKEMSLVWDRLCHLSQHDLNRLFYKSNLYSFCELPVVNDLIVKMLSELKEPFVNPYNAPEEIKDDLELFVSMLREYVYYAYPYIDKLDRAEYMQRDVTAAGDTDSTIISMDAWYRFVLGKVYDKDMPIKRMVFNMGDVMGMDDWGDKKKRLLYKVVEPDLDYNFYTDEVMEVERLRQMYKLIPQDSLRFSIINIMAYVCSMLVNDYIIQYCKRAGSFREDKPDIVNMKTEFLWGRMMLTAMRKNYASYMLRQEGNAIPNNRKARLGITGLSINKSILSDEIKDTLQNLLYEEIMTADRIDQIRIMKKLILIEKEIVKSIQNGETKYYKPDNISAMRHYEDPFRINGIVGSLIYNELREPGQPAINLEERNAIYKIKLNITKSNVHTIKDKFPRIHQKLLELMKHPVLGSRLGTISFPVDSPVPEWVLYFVDINTIVNDNIKNFPLDSIGLKRLENDNVNYSNIITL